MIQKILLASDGSANALRAAALANELLKEIPRAAVTVLVVNDMLDKMKFYSPLRSAVIFEEVEQFFREKAGEALAKTMAVFDREHSRVSAEIKTGNPADEILEFAGAGGYDLIIVGSRGMGSIRGLLMGSVSTKVVQLAACPVTVVK